MKTLALLLLSYAAYAQSFQYQAKVEPVKKSGYYRIELSPDVVGRLQEGLGDIRLYDGRKRELPYLLTRQTGAEATAFVPFGVVKKTNGPNVHTTVIVKRPTSQAIQSIGIEIMNTKVEKKASLSGSNDGSSWYALDDAVLLGRNDNSSTTTTRQTITFPLSDYTYFRLTVNDSTSAPLNILRIGSYGQTSESSRYTPVSGIQFTQHDSSDHYTYLMLDRDTPARLDQLTIHVSNPTLFRRQAAFGHNFTETTVYKRRKRSRLLQQAFDPLFSVTLSSMGDTLIQLPGLLTDKLCLRIANGDDPPLQIKSIDAAQITTYLTAELQVDSTYLLRFGNASVLGPIYDLAYFKNQLPGTLPVVSVGAVTDQSGRSLPENKASLVSSQYLVWGVITVVLMLLGIMTRRMLLEKDSRQIDV